MLTGIIGAGLLCSSAYGLWRIHPATRLRRIIRAYFDDEVRVVRLKPIKNGLSVQLRLPLGMTMEQFEKQIPGLEMAVNCPIIAKHLAGRSVEMRLGFAEFKENMPYDVSLLKQGELSIPLYTPFGLEYLDFWDESNCHLLQGGATRMGKSVFLRLLTTHLMKSLNGNVRFLLIDNKVTDLWMFRDIPQIQIAETDTEAKVFVDDIIKEVLERKERLKAKKDVIDLKEYRKRFPDEPMEPIFVVIDEYGRFAEDDDFQEMITFLAETAGYLDVHVIISAQRPDASTVLKPRIRANLLTRLAFTTADAKNSEIILGIPDAAQLGRIKGRAILFDGFPMKVQIPYLDAHKAKELLAEYYVREGDENVAERQTDHPVSEALPSFVKGSLSELGLS